MAAKTSDWRPGPTVCRCCFADGCYKDISTEYFWMGKREVYSEMLSDTFDVSIAYAQTSGPNSNSRLICEPCISRLRDASDFKRQVQECEKVFLQHLAEPGSSMEYEILPETSQKEEVKLERVKIEAKLDDDDDDFDDQLGFDDDDDDDMDDEPLTKFASKIPKAESDDLINILQLGDDTKKPEKRKSSTKVKLTTVKKAKKKESPKPSASKAASKPVVEKKKKGPPTKTLCRPLGTLFDFGELKSATSKQSQKEFTPSRSASPLNCDSPPPKKLNAAPNALQPAVRIIKSKAKEQDLRQNVLTVFEFSTVYPFTYSPIMNQFECFVCSQMFPDTFLLREHMIESHTYMSLKNVVDSRRENILKVDVSIITCKICKFVPKDLIELKRHLKSEHNKCIDPELQDNMIPFKIEGGKNSYDCVICQANFKRIPMLIIHMNAHFINYSCEICGSGFMALHLLQNHLQVHENGNYPCDICGKVFTTNRKRGLHCRTVHLDQHSWRCPMCTERFKTYYGRNKHIQDVHNVATKVHKCLQCGRAFNLKWHLTCHTRSVHLKERNHACDICHKRFNRKHHLKTHMAVHIGK